MQRLSPLLTTGCTAVAPGLPVPSAGKRPDTASVAGLAAIASPFRSKDGARYKINPLPKYERKEGQGGGDSSPAPHALLRQGSCLSGDSPPHLSLIKS